MKAELIKKLVKKAYESEAEKYYLLPFEESYQGNSLGKDEEYWELILGDVEKVIIEEEIRDDAYNTQYRRGFFIPKKLGTILQNTWVRTFNGYEESTSYFVFTKKGWVEVEV